jgi:hypothetical protein
MGIVAVGSLKAVPLEESTDSWPIIFHDIADSFLYEF